MSNYKYIKLLVCLLPLTGCSALNSEKFAEVIDVKSLVGEAVFNENPIREITLECLPPPVVGGAERAYTKNTIFGTGERDVELLELAVNNTTPSKIVGSSAYKEIGNLLGSVNYTSSPTENPSFEGGPEFGVSRKILADEFSKLKLDLTGKKPIVSTNQILQLLLNISNSSILAGASASVSSISSVTNDPWLAFKRYFAFYASEGFVSRDGTELKRLEVKKQTGAEEISAITKIFLEALIDAGLKTPIFVDEKGAPLVGGKVPTAIKAMVISPTEILSESRGEFCGITKLEHDIISRSAAFDADMSGLTSEALLEIFGNFEVSFVVGAEISFGDADTVSAVVHTISDVLTKAVRERAFIEFFHHLSYTRQSQSGAESSTGLRLGNSEEIRSQNRILVDFKAIEVAANSGPEFSQPSTTMIQRSRKRNLTEIVFLTKIMDEIDAAEAQGELQ